MVNPGRRTVNYRASRAPGWVVLALGSNLGDRLAFLSLARTRLREQGFPWELASQVEETAPVGGPPGQGPYLNQVLAAPVAAVRLGPAALLAVCKGIEREAGRVPGPRWGPRTLDVDIVLFGARVIRTARLTTPHPRLAERDFVLRPLARLLPDLVHPVLGETMAVLAARALPRGTSAP